MEECDVCLRKIKNKNKKKPCLTKKHKYFSNLIIKKYIMRNPEIDKFKDIIQPYYENHKKSSISFLYVLWARKQMCF